MANSLTKKMEKTNTNGTIINAENMILGRMAAYAAKQALLGEKIDITNCEKAIITGNKKNIIKKYKQRRARGQLNQGPYIPRRPDMFVKRAIRGMLPHKQEKGIQAYKRIMCHLGVPEEMKDKKTTTIKGASIEKLPSTKYLKVEQICKELGH